MTTKTEEQAEAKIAEMVRRIVEKFDPDKIILFGSFASGTADADSDVAFYPRAAAFMRRATRERRRSARHECRGSGKQNIPCAARRSKR